MSSSHVIVALFHILFVVPLFGYVAFQRAATEDWIYNVMLALGGIVLFYHGYKSAVRLLAGSTFAWVNIFHVLIVAPLLLYIGYNGKKTPRAGYELLMMVTFAALGYHLYNMVNELQTFTDK
jgi:hypothetical protein